MRTMLQKLLLLLLVGTLAAPALGGPAPWYWWVSRSSEARICWQTSPGEGWFREAQAFRDAHCRSRL
ncbi:MAG: hypothetical protein CVU18_19220 [Betaproteobacteria bacterium HGW-Betaproteobacteria-12]|jgi:hypothetical protein|nr:MAG: hypothetical protein CVU18_19220 [Betaproteobacteria bacterium HGW-Betaproteobacteria-12]